MLKISIHIARHTAYVLIRVARLGLLLFLVSGIGTLLVSRYYLLPHIENYHDQIVYAVSSAFGRPVTIGRVEGDWHGFRPRLLMINVRFKDQQGATALALEKVEGEVAWTSLFAGQVRLYSLILDQPDLSIKRDSGGNVFVAGLMMSGTASNGTSADWLLNQSRIEVRDARIMWEDEVRSAPPLVFNDVNLVIDNGWRRHRFAFRALPPQALSAQVDVRGDFHGASFDDMSGWHGQLFAQLDYADVAAWRVWLPLPVPLKSGKGALRGWLDVEGGKMSAVTADLALSNVRTRLADDLPMIDLRTLHGRVAWHDVERGLEVSTRNLSLRLRNGFDLSPTDFYLRYALKQKQGQASGIVRANKLDLLGLSTLSEYLPFNRGFKRQLAAFDPRGRVTDLYADWDWQGDADKLLRFTLKARFSGMAMKRVGEIPGFSGLTGRVDGNDAGGDVAITSRKLTLETPPDILPQKIEFDTLAAQIGWETGWRGLQVKFNNVSFSNPDMEGMLNASYRTVSGSPGAIDLTAHLTRAVVRNVDRYLPIPTIGKGAHAWLASGLVGGRSDDVSVRLAGDLAKFPYPDRKDGEFVVRAHVKDAAVEFLKDWPRIENINGDLTINGSRLEIDAPTAATLGSPLQNVSAAIPDLLSPALSLRVYGESAGDAGRALEYTRKSPVRGLLGGFTDNATATGKGALKLNLDIPLVGNRPVKVDGSYRLLGADVDLGKGIPLLQQASGDVLFTESSVNTRNLTLRTLGGPAKIEVKSADAGKVIRVSASGTSNMDSLRGVSAQPVLRYLHGGSPWDLAVTAEGGQTSVVFTSSLVGMTSDLPAPFAKAAGEKLPLRFEQTIQGGQREKISVQCGELVEAQVNRYMEDGQWKIREGVVGFGKHRKWPMRRGLWLNGDISHLSLEGWGPMFAMLGGRAASDQNDTGVAGMDLHIARVTGFRQSVDNLHIGASAAKGKLTAHLASRQLNGTVTWEPRGDGLLSLHLFNLALTNGAHKEGEPAAGAGDGVGKPVPGEATATHGESPDIHLVVDDFSYQGKALGALELKARQHEGDWLLQQVVLKTQEGVMTGSGTWQAVSLQPHTEITFTLDINDVGSLLARMGYPDTVRKGHGRLSGALSWPGGPGDFDYSVLNGSLGVAVDDGEFRKIKPEVSGLLRILSLQAFSPVGVFSDGFVFDSIGGTARIKQGLLTTDDFNIKGAALRVRLTGEVDLNKETQTLKIVMEPAVSGGAALLLASIANPVIALEFWVVNRFFRGPVEKVASVTFNVAGTWKDPVVSKQGEQKAPPETGGK